MNNSNQKYVPFVYAAAVLLGLLVLWFIVYPKWNEYQAAKENAASSAREKESLQQQVNDIESKQALDEMKMKNIKTIVETNVSSSDENLAMFGNMFEQILGKVQSNGIHIRSIEYDLSPQLDPIYALNADGYNVCELKLTLVGSYGQLKTFISDLNGLEHLLYISKMDVTAFSGNTDYLLAKLSINLYSKKAEVLGMRPNPSVPFQQQQPPRK